MFVDVCQGSDRVLSKRKRELGKKQFETCIRYSKIVYARNKNGKRIPVTGVSLRKTLAEKMGNSCARCASTLVIIWPAKAKRTIRRELKISQETALEAQRTGQNLRWTRLLQHKLSIIRHFLDQLIRAEAREILASKVAKLISTFATCSKGAEW